MQASKVSFFESTRNQINNNPIIKSRTAKSRLRAARVKEFILANEGKKLTMSDLIYAAGYREEQYGTGFAFIQRMDKNNQIQIEKSKKFKKWVTVPGGKSYTPPPVKEETPEQSPQTPDTSIDFIFKVQDLAIKFAWKENSDSLREFVKSLK